MRSLLRRSRSVLAATAVLVAPASGSDDSGALADRAGRSSSMSPAKPSSCSNVTAAFRRLSTPLSCCRASCTSLSSCGRVLVQPSRRRSPNAPCVMHNPRACALVVQPSTEQGLPPCFLQLAFTLGDAQAAIKRRNTANRSTRQHAAAYQRNQTTVCKTNSPLGWPYIHERARERGGGEGVGERRK